MITACKKCGTETYVRSPSDAPVCAVCRRGHRQSTLEESAA